MSEIKAEKHQCQVDKQGPSALRFHAGELVLATAFKSLLIVLLSIPVEVILTTEAIIACFTLSHHMNIHFRGERFLKWILIVPYLHRVHNSTIRSEHDNNFGSVFSIWDGIFGTLCDMIPKSIGLPGVVRQNAWQTFRYGLSSDLPAIASEGSRPKISESDRLRGRVVEVRVGTHPDGSRGYFDQVVPRTVELDRTMSTVKTPGHESIAIRERYTYNFLNMNNVFEFTLANVSLAREVKECAWRLNFACVMTAAKASSLESAGPPRKPGA